MNIEKTGDDSFRIPKPQPPQEYEEISFGTLTTRISDKEGKLAENKIRAREQKDIIDQSMAKEQKDLDDLKAVRDALLVQYPELGQSAAVGYVIP